MKLEQKQNRESAKWQVCCICGMTWNVSILTQTPDRLYRCPVCRKKGRENR